MESPGIPGRFTREARGDLGLGGAQDARRLCPTEARRQYAPSGSSTAGIVRSISDMSKPTDQCSM